MAETIIISPLITNLLAIGIVILVVSTLLLPRMIRHLVHSIILIAFGIIPILHSYKMIGFNIPSWPIVGYALTVIIILSGRTLIVDGFKEENRALKFLTIAAGFVIILVVTIPTLYNLGAITFNLTYPPIINNILYMSAGVLLLIGTMILKN